MKTLYEVLDEEGKSIFDNARRTVIREMEAMKEYDAESCVIYLIDAIRQISKLQRFALHNTEMKISDICLKEEKSKMERCSNCGAAFQEWIRPEPQNPDTIAIMNALELLGWPDDW